MSYISDIDNALKILVEMRRTVVPTLGTDDQAMDTLAAIQGTMIHLVKARDQEAQLENSTSSIYNAVVQSITRSQ
ncbi:UNVERIFIED_ORG: hypothetical protein GGE44_004261 [Rhizobium esperanzae]